MPTLVHLADANNAEKIRKNGLKPGKIQRGVYCMPVLPDFYVTHQWLRELKASGVKTLVAVYFKADENEVVWIRKLGGMHRKKILSEAIKEIWDAENKEGYELIFDTKIEAGNIVKIKDLSQKIGWRYSPGSHGTAPCTCEMCMRGKIKGKRTIKRMLEKEK